MRPTLAPMGPMHDLLLIDGATGSELERRGVDTSLPLWSARALLEAPDVLERIHLDYLDAGAMAITANTFRTHRRTLEKAGLGDRVAELTTRAVRIAQRAVRLRSAGALILGSVAPLEDCYEPSLAPDTETCLREHTEMIRHLLEAGVDRVLIETMNNLAEARAAAEAACRLAPGQWMISFCVRGDAEPGILLSGERLALLTPDLTDAIAVGVNCLAAHAVHENVRMLRAALPDEVRIMAYANVGHADPERGWTNTDAIDPERYAEYALDWFNADASIIGGCCGTTPATITALAKMKSQVHTDERRRWREMSG